MLVPFQLQHLHLYKKSQPLEDKKEWMLLIHLHPFRLHNNKESEILLDPFCSDWECSRLNWIKNRPDKCFLLFFKSFFFHSKKYVFYTSGYKKKKKNPQYFIQYFTVEEYLPVTTFGKWSSVYKVWSFGYFIFLGVSFWNVSISGDSLFLSVHKKNMLFHILFSKSCYVVLSLIKL